MMQCVFGLHRKLASLFFIVWCRDNYVRILFLSGNFASIEQQECNCQYTPFENTGDGDSPPDTSQGVESPPEAERDTEKIETNANNGGWYGTSDSVKYSSTQDLEDHEDLGESHNEKVFFS